MMFENSRYVLKTTIEKFWPNFFKMALRITNENNVRYQKNSAYKYSYTQKPNYQFFLTKDVMETITNQYGIKFLDYKCYIAFRSILVIELRRLLHQGITYNKVVARFPYFLDLEGFTLMTEEYIDGVEEPDFDFPEEFHEVYDKFLNTYIHEYISPFVVFPCEEEKDEFYVYFRIKIANIYEGIFDNIKTSGDHELVSLEMLLDAYNDMKLEKIQEPNFGIEYNLKENLAQLHPGKTITKDVCSYLNNMFNVILTKMTNILNITFLTIIFF